MPHPILDCIDTFSDALKSVADVQPTFMTTPEKAVALTELARIASQVAALRLRVMAAAGDVAEAHGMRDVASWFATEAHAPLEHAQSDAWLASALDRRFGAVADAMAGGLASLSQARVIVEALDDLPRDLGSDVLADAEAALVAYAESFTPKQLRRLGRRILDVVAPEIAEAEEAKRLAAEEDHARRACSLKLRAVGDGTTRLSGLLPDATAARLETYLDAFTSPRHAAVNDAPTELLGQTGEVDRIPMSRRRGQAFCALLEHLDPTKLPAHGGDATTVIVTMTLDSLRTELATAGLLDGDLTSGANLTAREARRLACNAQLVPAVLGGKSEVLDLGRSQRLFSPAQRKALRLRDQHCRADGCTIPATWCEAHHLTPWSALGGTNLDDGILFCTFHHHRIHDDRYLHERMASGDVRFHRRR